MPQLIENSDGVASQVRTQGFVEAARGGGDGDHKLPPRYLGCTAHTHYFKF